MARKRSSQKKTRKRSSQKKTRTSKFMRAISRLKKLKPNEQSQAMSLANDSFIRQFCGQVKKMKHANLSTKQRKVLKSHRKNLQSLVNKRTGISKKRNILSQRGGGIIKNILHSIPIVGDIMDMW